MAYTRARRPLLALAGVITACLLAAGPAVANGPCGQNFDGNHACGINTASTTSYPGTIMTDNESDYYVLHAQKGTELTVTITDTEAPGCSTSGTVGCGDVWVDLDNAKGDEIDDRASSQPNNGITVPGKVAHTIDATGTYYLIVGGDLGVDGNGNPTDVPYDLQVNASPAVQWPPPPPSCKVPKYDVGGGLSTVEARIVAAHCSVGTIVHRHTRHAPRGTVLSLDPGSGTVLGSNAPVSVVVSSGRRHKKHHRHHHRHHRHHH